MSESDRPANPSDQVPLPAATRLGARYYRLDGPHDELAPLEVFQDPHTGGVFAIESGYLAQVGDVFASPFVLDREAPALMTYPSDGAQAAPLRGVLPDDPTLGRLPDPHSLEGEEEATLRLEPRQVRALRHALATFRQHYPADPATAQVLAEIHAQLTPSAGGTP